MPVLRAMTRNGLRWGIAASMSRRSSSYDRIRSRRQSDSGMSFTFFTGFVTMSPESMALVNMPLRMASSRFVVIPLTFFSLRLRYSSTCIGVISSM